MLPALALLFFLSGASALIYQVVWLRLLSLVFGVTVYAASTVLACFMAGLALGSVLAGRLADRVRRPLRWFGVAELLIGGTALLSPVFLEALMRWYVPLSADATGAMRTIARIICCALVLLPPTTLMGATLPLILRSSLVDAAGIGARVSLLYGINTAGAIAGALLAGFVLVGTVGVTATFRVAAAINVVVGVAAVVLDSRAPAASRIDDVPVSAASPDPRSASPGAGALVPIVFAISGLTSLALEVIWFRTLVLYFPATTYAFTAMLASVLAGIAAGSLLAAPILRRVAPSLSWFGVLHAGIGAAAVAGFVILGAQYRADWAARGVTAGAALAILPSAILMGAAFPTGIRLWVRTVGDAGQRLGLLYALNLLGAIAGSMVAGFLLLPRLGSARSLAVAAGLNVAVGVVLIVAGAREATTPDDKEATTPDDKEATIKRSSESHERYAKANRKRRGFRLQAEGIAASATRRSMAALFGALMVVSYLALIRNLPDPFITGLSKRYRDAGRIFFRDEGVQTTVSVHVRELGGRQLYLDGLHQASDGRDVVQMHLRIGHLPVLLHPAPRRALVIGMGGGATAGAVSLHPGLQVDIVELAPGVVKAAEWFTHINEGVLQRPNVRLRVDDARNFLLVGRDRYDVITADIIQPTHAGAGLLYSQEYFALARSALSDGGVMVQWVGPRSELYYKLIARTFQSVFPETTVWVNGSLLIGSTRPLETDRAVLARRFESPQLQASLSAGGFPDAESVLAQYTAGARELRDFLGPGPVLTDDKPMLEYYLSLPESDKAVDLGVLKRR